jgi:hypothetical protein
MIAFCDAFTSTASGVWSVVPVSWACRFGGRARQYIPAAGAPEGFAPNATRPAQSLPRALQPAQRTRYIPYRLVVKANRYLGSRAHPRERRSFGLIRRWIVRLRLKHRRLGCAVREASHHATGHPCSQFASAFPQLETRPSRIIQKPELIESMAETVGVENTAGVRC